MVFGALRYCYSAPCKFYADDGARTNRIRWYWAPEGAEIYEDWTTFTPRIDDLDTDPTNLYEFTAKRTRQRRYDAHPVAWPTTGEHVDGTRQDFLGKTPRATYWIGGHAPANPCGLVERLRAGFRIGAALPRDLQPDFKINLGLQLGCALAMPAPWPTIYPAGLQLGAALIIPPPPPPRIRPGLILGAAIMAPPSPVLRAGFQIGGLLSAELPADFSLSAGMAFGATLSLATIETPICAAGMMLGAALSVPTDVPEPLRAGLVIGADLLSPSLRAGLLLGGTCVPAEVVPVVVIETAGLVLGAVMLPTTETLSAGMLLGVGLVDPSIEAMPLRAGIRLGFVFAPEAEVLDAGIQLGAVLTDPTILGEPLEAGFVLGATLIEIPPVHACGILLGAGLIEETPVHKAGLLLGGGISFDETPCVFCDGADMAPTATIEIDCPDLPALDGMTLSMTWITTGDYRCRYVGAQDLGGGASLSGSVYAPPLFPGNVGAFLHYQQDGGDDVIFDLGLTDTFACDPIAFAVTSTVVVNGEVQSFTANLGVSTP